MIKGLVIVVFWLSLMSSAIGNPIAMEVYELKNEKGEFGIDEVIKSNQFSKVEHIGSLNFGISISNYWLKILVKNTVPNATYKLVISSIVPDTIEIYELKEGILKKELIGEAIPSEERFINYYFKTADTTLSASRTIPQGGTVFYLKIRGDGQPIALPLSIVRSDMGDDMGILSILFSGLLYGIVCFILIINLVLYIGNPERLYLYFFIFNIFCTGVVLYFDGFVKLLFFPNSLYWNNQFVAIALCGSFISINYYIQEFLKIKQHRPALTKYFKGINILFWVVLGLSFWHPTGFNWYIRFNIVITTAEAILLFTSVMLVRQMEKEYFMVQLISISSVIVFGTILQLYYVGVLPINGITRYAVHCMILPQILIQTFALGKRFTILAKERRVLQEALLETSEQYSQSLISTLENERKRLSSEFHDSIGQNLLVIRNRILLMLKQNQSPLQKDKLDGLASITSETLDEIRAISQNLRPTTLDTIGLTASLNNMMERLKRSTEIEIDYNCTENIDAIIAKDLEINIYRILQELTNNILKHSQALVATIEISVQNHQLLIQVKDDGVGFDAEKKLISNTGNGLSSIKERVKILRGDMTITSEKRKGTFVNIKIPISK
jgi:two-component system, sensor histidine kinase LadS